MSDWITSSSNRFIIDSGSNHITYGTSCQEPNLIENLKCIDKNTGLQVFGKTLDTILTDHKFIMTRPLTRGVIVTFESEIQLWEHILQEMSEQQDKISYNQSAIVMTLQLFSPKQVKQRIFETVFDYWGFNGFMPIHPQKAIQQYTKVQSQFQLIVESSDSATYIVPFFDNEIMVDSVKKLEIGGRILTNYLSEIISLKQLDLKQEYRLVRQIKEDMCYVSTHFKLDMQSQKGSHQKYFIMPQSEVGKKGYVSDKIEINSYNQQIHLDKERFIVPELIFSPQNIGLQQAGISESIIQTVQSLDPQIQNYFYENIILSGGNTKFPNFKQRLYQDLRPNTPSIVELNINHLDQPNVVYDSCKSICNQSNFQSECITKSDYSEIGFDRLSQIYLI